MKLFLARLGSPYAISLRVWLWSTPIVITGSALTFGFDVLIGFPVETWLVAIGSHLLVGLLSLLASSTYLKKSKWVRPRPLIILGTYFLFGLSRGAFIAFAALITDIPAEPDFLGRSLSGAWVFMFWATLLTLVFESSARYNKAKDLLAAKVAELSSLKGFRLESVANLRRDYLAQVEQTLAPAIDQVRNSFDLENLANQIIQPQSFDALEIRVRSSQELQAKTSSFSIRQAIRDAFTLSYNPAATALLAVVGLAFPFLYQGGLAGLTQLGVNFISLYLAVLVFSRRTGGPYISAALLIGLFSGCLFGASLLERQLLVGVISFVNLSVGSWLIAIFLMFLSALDRRRDALAEELRGAVAELEALDARLRQELWLERRQLDQLVHSEIQGRLRAAAVLAKTTGRQSDLEKLKAECIAALSPGAKPLTLAEFQDELQTLWGASLDLAVSIDDKAAAAIEIDDYLGNAVFLVVREGIINAVKHADAKQISVSLRMESQTLFKVEVINDGAESSGSRQGLGTELLNQLSLSWELKRIAKSTQLSALLPIAN